MVDMLTRALVRARAIGDKAKPMGAGSKQIGFAIERGRAVLTAPLMALAYWALPPRCPGCAEPVEADHRFCSPCWGQLRFLDTGGCTACGMPLGGLTGRCGACLADPPRHAGIHAAVAYGPIARQLPIRLKHGGRIGVAETMAGPMARRMRCYLCSPPRRPAAQRSFPALPVQQRARVGSATGAVGARGPSQRPACQCEKSERATATVAVNLNPTRLRTFCADE